MSQGQCALAFALTVGMMAKYDIAIAVDDI